MRQGTTKPKIRRVNQRKLRSEPSLIACVFYSLRAIKRWMNKNPCHTGWMYRLIGIFAGRKGLIALRKHAYSNILKISPPKTESFQLKILIFFHISAQNIGCGYPFEPPRRGGSNEYPQSMFLNRNKKNNVYPCEPQFYYIKVGFKGVKII